MWADISADMCIEMYAGIVDDHDYDGHNDHQAPHNDDDDDAGG